MQLQVKMPQNSRNKLFKSKQTTNKVLSEIFRGLEVRRKLRLMFRTTKNNMKDKSHAFSGYKQY